MGQFTKNLIPIIESRYDAFTPSERQVADFFMQHNRETLHQDNSAEAIANLLHVSVPTLTRFAKKCGFSGYREFIFEYEATSAKTSQITDTMIQHVLSDYEELISKTYSLIDEAQFKRITKHLHEANRVYIYGKGSSGLVAREMKLRFTRINLICEAITDDDMMRMNHVVVDENCVVIGLSVSGQSEPIIEGLQQAKKQGAKTVMLTTNNQEDFVKKFDEVLLIAQKKRLSQGNQISPQFPLLIMIDIFYMYFKNADRERRSNLFQHTLEALNITDEGD